jgi:hypothetical protein
VEERRKENREDSNEERDGAWKEDGGKMFCGNGGRIWGGRMEDGWGTDGGLRKDAVWPVMKGGWKRKEDAE